MEKTLFYHGTTRDGRRYTIAGVFGAKVKGIEDEDIIGFGLSLCSNTDQFNKRVGRKKAEGRLIANNIKGKSYYHLYNEESSLNWFKGKELDTFLTAVQLNDLLSAKQIQEKFHLNDR